MNKAIRNIKKIKNDIFHSDELTIIIPAAGEGTRMKAFGPKSLIKLSNKLTVIDHQIQLIHKQFPFANIVLVHGYEANKVMNYLSTKEEYSKKNIINLENERYKTTNVVRSIAIGLRATLTNKVLIMYGDLICNLSMLKIPDETQSSLYIDISNTMTENEVGCVIQNRLIEHMIYDLPNKWAQIAYITGLELTLLKKIVYNPTNENLLGFEVFNEIINQDGKFVPIKPKRGWANDIDCVKDLTIIQNKL